MHLEKVSDRHRGDKTCRAARTVSAMSLLSLDVSMTTVLVVMEASKGRSSSARLMR